MNETFFSDLQKEFDKTVTAFRRDLSKVRTGRASTALLEGIMVDYYGTPTPLNQLGNLSVPEPRLLVIQAYDPTAMSNIEKAILKGLLPAQLGEAELAAAIGEIVATLADRSPKAVGAVMAQLKARFGATYDGALASKLTRAALSA